jgi:AraC-like DNA-binding protein
VIFSAGSRTRLVDEETFRRLVRSREWLGDSCCEQVTLRQAASAACLSPFHYQRLFTKVFGESPHRFVTNRRLERAREMLARDHADVTEVCFAVGYSSLGSFSTLFRQQVGLSPSEFRRGLRKLFPAPELPPFLFIPGCFLSRYGVRPF